MKAMLRKDLPWIDGVFVLGMLAMVLALHEASFISVFVTTARHHEALFHTAWPCGLVLGVVAACFDEVLRTREFLAQRPTTALGIARSRFAGCAIVLALWFVAVPLVAYATFAFDDYWEIGHWRQLASIWATMTPTVSGCAIGLAAGSLPFVWWGRLWCLSLLLLVPFSAIYWLERGAWGPDPLGGWILFSPSRSSWFVGGHLALAGAALLVAIAAARTRRDVDRPLAPATRTRVVAPLLALCAALMGVGCRVLADESVRMLHVEYPEAVDHDGRIVLLTRDPEGARGSSASLVVNEHHQPTGERLALQTWPTVMNRHSVWWRYDFFRIEQPRWDGVQSTGFATAGSLWIEPDGRVLWMPVLERRLRWIVKPDGSAFVPGSRLCGRSWFDVPALKGDAAIVEPGRDGIWVFDAETASVRDVPLPDADRAQGVLEVHEPGELVGVPAGLNLTRGDSLVRGERGLYAVRRGKLVAAGTLAPRENSKRSKWRASIPDPDPLTWTLVVADADGAQAFQHAFTPRTFGERMCAMFALAISVLRSPLLQVAGTLQPSRGEWRSLLDVEVSRWWWLFDPLVAGGRRIWLVLASIGLAVLCALLVRWQLRLFGADAAAFRFWTIATLLLGPVAVLGFSVLERRRAWTERRVAIPAPAPRIVTPELEENVP